VPAFLTATDGLILEELHRTIAYGARDFIYGSGLPIAAVLSWTSHRAPPKTLATEFTENTEN
jgi:hypothetical protein